MDDIKIIKNELLLIDNESRIKLFSLSKIILNFQEMNNFKILDTINTNLCIVSFLQDYRISDYISESEYIYYDLAKIYNNFELFSDLINIINSTKKIEKIVNNNLTKNENIKVKKLFNIICLINLIKFKLYNRTRKDINYILDFLQLIKVEMLNLQQLYNLNTVIEINNFLEIYNYLNINIFLIYKIFYGNDEKENYHEYDKIYNLFYNF
jgi:hypothetical protein